VQPGDILCENTLPGSLANMSARPRTPVSRQVRPIRDTWVAFTWSGFRPRLTNERLAALDAAWAAFGFTGCALLQPVNETVRRLSPLECRDDDVVLNVLLRSRSGILLGTSPLLDDASILRGLVLASDDPRLYAIVSSRSHRRLR